jgi:hypothetical protein
MAELPSVIECARLYLSPPAEAFWRWSEDQSAIVWREGGDTIMLREELAIWILRRVDVALGLPRLHAVIVLAVLLRQPEHQAFQQVLAAQLQPAERAALPDLTEVRALIRSNPEARTVFYDWVLHAASDNSVPFASRVAQAMHAGLPDNLLAPRDTKAPPLPVVVQWIRFGLQGLTPERLALLARTGVDQLPVAAANQQALQETSKSLLQSLDEDVELAGFAKVVHEVMAALRVPRLLRSPQDQAQGGIAGLSNRGSLDRLAISELAHDDHVLAVRIATNEALYVEREVPEAAPRCHRHILLDCGVRMWGAPRVLSVAVALALCANADPAVAISVAAVVAGSAETVDLSQRAGLIAQLERLDWDLDLRSFLPSFFADIQEHDEPVLIVHRETIADPEFRALLVTPVGRRYVVDLAENGAARLWEVQARGWRQISAATLATDGLLRRLPSATPAYYQVHPAPLMLARVKAPDVTALAWSSGKIGLRTRRGRNFVVRLGRRGHVTLGPTDESMTVIPFLPHPGGEQPSLQSAELGTTHTVFWDASLLHFVPRHVGGRELTVRVSMQVVLQGYCSEGGVLVGEALLQRLLEIVAEVV